MNFLAHIYLSDNDRFIELGNFMADAVKGNSYTIYTEKVQVGILLHRQIDSFTDRDETARISKRRMHKRYGHYSGVIIDILYDHFLAKNWEKYSDVPLADFTHNFYVFLDDKFELLPERIQKLTPFMIKHDWLTNYASFEGIEAVLKGMNRRTKGISKMDLAINDLKEHYTELESDFFIFFDKLMDFSAKKMVFLKKQYQII